MVQKKLVLVPKELRERPKTLEEFQDFFFSWEEFDVMVSGDNTRTLRLALWNAKRIKGKIAITETEASRIAHRHRGQTYHHYHDRNMDDYNRHIKFKGWKDSDNPYDIGRCHPSCNCQYNLQAEKNAGVYD